MTANRSSYGYYNTYYNTWAHSPQLWVCLTGEVVDFIQHSIPISVAGQSLAFLEGVLS